MLVFRIYFAVDSMPVEMYGESWIAGLLTSDDVMLYMAGFVHIHGMNYTEVINVSSAANSTRIDYSTIRMHNTDTFIEESMVPNKEDAVHGHVSDTAPLPSERG